MNDEMLTPKTTIREVARDSASEARPREVIPEQPAKKQRGGGGGMTMAPDTTLTPKTNIALVANAPTVSTGASSAAFQDQTGRTTTTTSSKTPKDPRKVLKRYLKVAKTDSTTKKPSPTRQGDDFDGEPDPEIESLESDVEEEGKPTIPETGESQVIGRQRHRVRRVGTLVTRRRIERTPGEIPFLNTTNFFRGSLGELSRPNRPTAGALEEAHASLNLYLERSVRDYARLARIDDVAPHNLTRVRVEQLLREQGLLVRPIGDEIRRLLDREDADVALALPISRARASRM